MDILNNIDGHPKLAPKRLRILACLIDFTIFWIVGFIAGAFFGQYYEDGETIGYHLNGPAASIPLLAWFIFFPIIEGYTGQTIGKRLLRIKVVKSDFSKISVTSSFLRHIFDIIDFIFFVGLIIATTNKSNQRIGDLVSNTIVVMKEPT